MLRYLISILEMIVFQRGFALNAKCVDTDQILCVIYGCKFCCKTFTLYAQRPSKVIPPIVF